MTTIAIVDYGAGNLTSVVHGLEAVGAAVRVASGAADLDGADGVLVPGVGHFSQTAGLDDVWRQTVLAMIDRGVPLLGICLGMQWLFGGSDEAPDLPGLGVFAGHAVRLTSQGGSIKVPHVGWNALAPTGRPSRLLRGLPPRSFGYFAHTYAVPPNDTAVALTEHGTMFSAVVEFDRTFGIQCHPEKSGPTGLAMLRNFVAIAGEAQGC